MKKYLLITLIITLIPAYIVYLSFNQAPTTKGEESKQKVTNTFACGAGQSRADALSSMEFGGLRKLGELEDFCDTKAADNLMVFTIMPKDDITARELAGKMAENLAEFQSSEVKPIVIVEPDSAWGLIDFGEFNTGFWDQWISTYFAELKSLGVTDEMMGMWVPFPEANLPLWNHQNASPKDYSSAVNRYLSILRKEFPSTKTSILLNSATYNTDDFDWSDGDYISLSPFVSGINKDLVDSFGVQGFPWMPRANGQGREIFEAREFINHPLVVEAATILEVDDVWINTGTFSTKYAGSIEEQVFVPANIRATILSAIVQEAETVKSAGFNVMVSTFAEDKSATAEATDWSYWGSDTTTDEDLVILTSFLNDLRIAGIEVSFFFR